MTAAYLQILIHNMNNSLFPDADPNSIAWTGPPPEIVTVQSLLYSSLATSLFAAFIAMLGKQWVNRYLRKHGGSAAEKSRERQQKLDGFIEWNFELVIESLPVMLQLALLLLGCALARYLWAISRTVAGVILAFTLLGITSYTFFTLVATLHYNCPYQTPLSTLNRLVIRHVAPSDSTFARSLRLLASSLPSIKDLGQLLGHLLSGFCRGLGCFHCGPTIAEGVEEIIQAAYGVPPARIFEDTLEGISVNWEVFKVDSRCIWWVLGYTTDLDVISSTSRYAVDKVWHPEIAGVVSPHVLADRFFDCFFSDKVIPGKSECASAIGVALGSVLSTRLVMEPESQELWELGRRIGEGIENVSLPDPTPFLVLGIVAQSVGDDQMGVGLEILADRSIVDSLSATTKLWLSRVVLQNFWWRRLRQCDPTVILSLHPFQFLYEGGGTDGDDTPTTLKTNWFLTVAISLGLQVNSRDLYPPSTTCVSSSTFSDVFYSLSRSKAFLKAASLVCQQLQTTIRQGNPLQEEKITLVLSALVHLDLFGYTQLEEPGFPLITDILGSSFSENGRYQMAAAVIRLLGNLFFKEDRNVDVRFLVDPTWIPPLLDFLSLSEKFYPTESPPYPGPIALRILSAAHIPPDFGTTILLTLPSTLLPTRPLQSRSLALKVFNAASLGLLSSQMESIAAGDLGHLLKAVGDPFVFALDPPLLDRRTRVMEPDYDPVDTMIVLIEFASSNLWRNHLLPLNFTTCENFLSEEEGKRTFIRLMLKTATYSWGDLLCTAAKVIAAIERLEELQCLNTAEVVVMWAWTVGVLDAEDPHAWRSIERNTHAFYQTRGIERPEALERYITNKLPGHSHSFQLPNGDPLRLVARIRRPGVLARARERRGLYVEEGLKWRGSSEDPGPGDKPEWLDVDAFLDISKVCQLKRLCCLFEQDHTEGKKAAVEEPGGQEMDLSLDVTPVSFVDWACDYP